MIKNLRTTKQFIFSSFTRRCKRNYRQIDVSTLENFQWKYTSRSKASLWGVVFDAFYSSKSLNDEVLTNKIYTQDLGKKS